MDIINSLYAYCQGCFIPLHPNTKKPVDTAWTSMSLNGQTAATCNAFVSVGYNVGYRIPDNTLIIDVDPRNGGTESFIMLPDDVQALPITTITPSGGYHIYTTIPEEYRSVPLRTTLKDQLPGIDFLRKGKQVLLPGSSLPGDFYYQELSVPVPDDLQLPDRLYYELHPSATTPPPVTPTSLLELLKRPITDSSSVPSGFLTNTDLVSVLQKLPVLSYNDNDSWLKIMLACHHATAGDGLEAFLMWSLQDPDYSQQEHIIRQRWTSASTEDTGAPMLTVRTLCHELHKHGPVPQWLRMKAGLQQNTSELFDPITADAAQQEKSSLAADYQQQIDSEPNAYKLLPAIAVAISSDAALLASHRDMLLRRLAHKTKVSITSIKADIASLLVQPTPPLQARQQQSQAMTTEEITTNGVEPLSDTQVDLCIATALLDRVAHDCSGVRPKYAAGSWWMWQTNHWQKTDADAQLRRICTSTIQNFGAIVKAGRVKEIIELARIQIEQSYADFTKPSSAIKIFATNGVIAYDTSTHKWIPSDHHPDNRNLSTINTHYDPQDTNTGRWSTFLRQAMTSPHAKRTLACAIVYAASSAPMWLRKAFFLYGPSGTGKSATLDCIESLLGSENCTALNITQLSSKNGPAELVGRLANISNETVTKKGFSDDVFKALVSGESVIAEKKFCDPFAFRNTAKFFLAANGFPKVSDDSDAVWNRIALLVYPNRLNERDMDPFLQDKFAKERPGILNWAMRIFAEEYEKDRCKSAMMVDTQGAVEMTRWRRVNNPALEWSRDRVEHTMDPAHRLPVAQAYEDYKIWSKRNGHRQAAKNSFSRHVNPQFQSSKDGDGRTVYIGAKLKPLAQFESVEVN